MTFNWPQVDIIIIAYKRYNEIQRTVESLVENLHYPNLHWLIADDATPGSHVARLKKLSLFKEINAEFIPAEQNLGWGGNANRAMAYSKADYVYFQEDDYLLTKSLDLRLGVALLEEKPHLGLLRWRGTAGDTPVFHQFESDISAYIPDWREGVSLVSGKLTYLQFDGHSPTLYIYSHGAHLKHRRFHDFYGKYPEGLKLGETEEATAHIVKNKMQADPAKAPGIVILPEWIPMYFDHIGQSFQHTPEDK